MTLSLQRIAIMLALATTALFSCGPSTSIVIGSKNFTEQIILGEMLAQQIERRTEIRVIRRLNLGGTFICDQAIRSGRIDAYVEYTGTALTAILQEPPEHDARRAFQKVSEAYRRAGLHWMPPLGFNNTFAILVRGEDARRLGLTTVSSLIPFASDWRAGFGYEFLERSDGLQGFLETYGLRFAAPPSVMELGLIYRALAEGRIDLTAGDATSGLISVLDLQALEDDLSYFPNYDAAPVVRLEILQRFPHLGAAIEELADTLSETQMRILNHQVDALQRPVSEVVRLFLEELH